MKLRSFVVLAVCAWSLPATHSIIAAETPAAKPAVPSNLRSLTNRSDRVSALTAELKLTPDQLEKLRPILQEESQKAAEIFRDTKVTRDVKLAKIKEVRDANRVKVKAILTPQQMEQWDKLRQGRSPVAPQRGRVTPG